MLHSPCGASLAALTALATLTPVASSLAIETTPVSGFLTARCTEEFRVETTGVTLVALKLGSADAPDMLLHEGTLGGPVIGGVAMAGSGYLIPANWREPISAGEQVAVFVLLDGHAFTDSDELLTSGGELAGTAIQVVGALDGPAPLVRATPHGCFVEFAPLVERAGALDANACGTGGLLRPGTELIVGYNVYRLDAEAWPDPSLRDFLVNGFMGHLRLADLDFEELDLGSGRSDLVPTDDFTLRNPDGLPGTGDEVIVLRDLSLSAAGVPREQAPDPAHHHWYRVQPVLRGQLEYFRHGSVSNNSVLTALLDLDGDGFEESADILGDGTAEFIDPSRNGLGLAHRGEILSSPEAGLGTPASPRPDADADGLPDTWEFDHLLDQGTSNAGLDTDGDRLDDLTEYSIGSHPHESDTDAGGEDDGREVLHGRSPLNASDDITIPADRPLGDVAPAGGGNSRIDVADVVRALRLAVGMESATSLDAVLADMAPADPLPDTGSGPLVKRRGDGRIDITDVVLQLRQAVGLVRVTD